MSLIKTARCPVDSSGEVIREWLDNGFTQAVWVNTEGACEICQPLDSQVFDLQELLSAQQHDAPIYTRSHPGCKCYLKVLRPEETVESCMICGANTIKRVGVCSCCGEHLDKNDIIALKGIK